MKGDKMADNKINNFSQLIAVHANGSTNQLFSETLQNMIAELSNRVIDRGGKQRGVLTLQVEIVLENGMVRINMNHPKSKMPEPAGQSDIMWATPENNLQTSNPKQYDMLRDVNTTAEIRNA